MPSLPGLRLSHGNVSLSDTGFMWRKKKGLDTPNNVEIVRSLSQVRMPRVFQIVEDLNNQEPQGYRSPDRIISLYSPSLDPSLNRFSRSESALDTMIMDESRPDAPDPSLDSGQLDIPSVTQQSEDMEDKQDNSHRALQGVHRTQSFENAMRTSFHLESSDESDADDDGSGGSTPTISPLSDRTPPASGTHWQRFFPELSSHFSLVSPISTDMQQHARLSPLDDAFEEAFEEGPVKPAARTSESSSSSQETFDDRSSCYSRRTSASSVDSEFPATNHKPADAYSIISPVGAGVFDDTASLRQRQTRFSTARLAIDELKNKPLPVEPPIEMSPLMVRRPNSISCHGSPTLRHTSRLSSKRRKDSQQLALPSVPRSHDLDALDEAFQLSSPRNLPGSRVHADYPTLLQAAEELENELAKYTNRLSVSKESSDILVQPLQISRGDMEMIATRSPPSPATKSTIRTAVEPKAALSLPRLNRAERRRTEDFTSIYGTRSKKPGKHRLRFSFSVSGIGRRLNHGSSRHFRSLSSASLDSAIGDLDERIREKPKIGALVGRTNTTINIRKSVLSPHASAELAASEFPSLKSHRRLQRQTSASSERELRLQLPRLQTERLERVTKDARRSVNSHSRMRDERGGIPKTNEQDQGEEKIVVTDNYLESPDRFSPALHANRIQLPQWKGQTQLSSIRRMSKIFELDAGLPSPSIHSCSLTEEIPYVMPADIPEDVILCIFENVDTLEDLFGLAKTSSRFYNTFKHHELKLMKNALFKMTPAAWELREMSPPWSTEWQHLTDPDAPVPTYTPTLYLRHHVRDIYTLAHVKSLLLLRCPSLLRRDTVRGLAGVDNVRAAEIDDALWRIWTFCRIFGSGKSRESDIRGQVDWLNGGRQAKQRTRAPSALVAEPFGMNDVLFEPPRGFAQGNGEGLTPAQLYDMTEIWTCLGVFLQPIYGRCTEARQFGVFDGLEITEGDIAKEEIMLEEWAYYVLTLGPSAILSVSPLCPPESAEATFRNAQSMGLTKWAPTESGASRASFLKEAVSRAYEARATGRYSPDRQATSMTDSRDPSPGLPASQPDVPSNSPTRPEQASPEDRRRREALADELRNQRERPHVPIAPSTDPSPISSYPALMNRLEEQWEHEGSDISTIAAIPDIPGIPGFHELPPISPSPPVSTTGYLPTLVEHPFYRQVLDPVDKAIYTIVHELGFSEEDAKWALKITDTGDSIDPDAAVDLLFKERKKRERTQRFAKLKRGPSTVDCPLLHPLVSSKSVSNVPGWRWA